jgi:hypothetical protein
MLMKMKIDYKNKKLLTPEEKASKDVEYMVKVSNLKFQSDVLATQKALEEAKSKYEDLKTDYPLDCAAIIKAKDEVKAWQNGLDSLIELGKELGFSIPE